MRPLLLLALLGLLRSSSLALTITLDLEQLKTQSSAPLPVSSLVVLTVATTGTFLGPTQSSFASGNELILGRWDLSGFRKPGVLSAITGDLSLSGNWNEGDPLLVYWYPTLTLDSTAPGSNTPFGSYRDAAGLDGSAVWVTPAGGSTISLKFFTSDATFLATGGSNPASAGRAVFMTVPEPGSLTLGLWAVLVLSLARRRSPTSVGAARNYRRQADGEQVKNARQLLASIAKLERSL